MSFHPVYTSYHCSILVHISSLLFLLKLVFTLSTPSLLESVWSFLWDIAYTWGLNPTFWYCDQGAHACIVLFIFLLVKVCHSLFWVELPHTSLCSNGDCLGTTLLWWGVAIGLNVLWSTPFPAQESTFGVTLREFPWTLKWVVLGRHMVLPVKCALHCTSPESGIQKNTICSRYTGQPMHPRCQLV